MHPEVHAEVQHKFQYELYGIVLKPVESDYSHVISVNRLPPAERRNYTSVFNALKRIVTEEGFTALWTVIKNISELQM